MQLTKVELHDSEMIRTLVSQGVIPYIKIVLNDFESGKIQRDTAISIIGRAVNEYDLFCQTGRGHA